MERERERKELAQSSLRLLPLPPDTDGVKARTGSWRELQLPGFHSNVDAGQVKREGEIDWETKRGRNGTRNSGGRKMSRENVLSGERKVHSIGRR